MSEWQPIETAPEDWSDVLLFDPEFPSDFRNVGEGYYDSEAEHWFSPAVGRVAPTHWMPLPAPPARQDGGVGG